VDQKDKFYERIARIEANPGARVPINPPKTAGLVREREPVRRRSLWPIPVFFGLGVVIGAAYFNSFEQFEAFMQPYRDQIPEDQYNMVKWAVRALALFIAFMLRRSLFTIIVPFVLGAVLWIPLVDHVKHHTPQIAERFPNMIARLETLTETNELAKNARDFATRTFPIPEETPAEAEQTVDTGAEAAPATPTEGTQDAGN
jgi:hypothetical protein